MRLLLSCFPWNVGDDYYVPTESCAVDGRESWESGRGRAGSRLVNLYDQPKRGETLTELLPCLLFVPQCLFFYLLVDLFYLLCEYILKLNQVILRIK